MEKIVALCKRRGFVFQSSEIYGGINGFWDYGPYGVTMRRAVEQLWWKMMVEDRQNVEGLDSTIICHPRVWQASGHLDQFSDLMTDCRECKRRYRVDQMDDPSTCPECGSKELTEPREFNLMMKTYVGPVFDDDHVAYLRAETCQPIFVDFESVRITARQKLPFGIAQTGKAFRNEINPRFFVFRSREFVQMEMEFFCREEEAMDWYSYWRDERWKFYTEYLSFPEEKLRVQDHDQLAHYAKAALDIEFAFPFGWGEIEGVHHRGTWDLGRHTEYCGKDLRYFDQERNERILPTVVETSCGLDRICLALLANGYREDMAETKKEGKEAEMRVSLSLPAIIAPVQVAVLPLVKKLADTAQPIYTDIKKRFRAEYDQGGTIGKRYRRQDEIGTPFCVTVDFDTLDDNAVTVRHRDSMEQERVSLDQLMSYLSDRILG
ncbi:MAG: glycine--tRNA ligase [Lentisphaerae bacterium]|nr:glycine--tRNA ligase [Lentisphaerota bacterium]MBT4822549.1 glycine--tRNA ligase [Lentisphaerota bacterium]MBT5604692.1 glycine--tRNA ligase [Lentisphaerota bacterium]MBT7053808.1 glycine--tRNA ligase [Lentisphaerota bacterium]MBT7847187.1 glycine--tRNA ligase [Lentisphaerota bacterium]